MKKRSLAAAGLALALGATVAAPSQANAALGNTSLAAVLTSDGDQFDTNWHDYDIVTEAVLAVLAAKPSSNVGLLADGNVKLTAFIPNDRAFQSLVKDITGTTYYSEKRVFKMLAGAVGIDAIEAVLLYHVVPGATITSGKALRSDGAVLSTGLPGATFKVNVIEPKLGIVALIDADTNDRNPFLNYTALDINLGNKQIAHGITQVLRPIDLP